MRPADIARVAVLVRRLAFRAGPLDVTVRQPHAVLFAIGLLDVAFDDRAAIPGALINPLAEPAILGRVRRIVVVKLDPETRKVAKVLAPNPIDELFGRDPLLLGPDHHRRAVRVVGAEIQAGIAAQLLKPHPNVRLEIFDQMPDVDRPVGIGQRRGNDDLARHGWSLSCEGSDASSEKSRLSFSCTGPPLPMDFSSAA
jgi:hypothetical protein